MSHFKIILETNPMICLCYKYPYQNTLEYKMNKRVGLQNNFKMRHESLGINKTILVLEEEKEEERKSPRTKTIPIPYKIISLLK